MVKSCILDILRKKTLIGNDGFEKFLFQTYEGLTRISTLRLIFIVPTLDSWNQILKRESSFFLKLSHLLFYIVFVLGEFTVYINLCGYILKLNSIWFKWLRSNGEASNCGIITFFIPSYKVRFEGIVFKMFLLPPKEFTHPLHMSLPCICLCWTMTMYTYQIYTFTSFTKFFLLIFHFFFLHLNILLLFYI